MEETPVTRKYATTDPSIHDPDNFRYLIHSFTETESIEPFEDDLYNVKRFLLSATLSDKNHLHPGMLANFGSAYAYGGMILDIPDENIIYSAPFDLEGRDQENSIFFGDNAPPRDVRESIEKRRFTALREKEGLKSGNQLLIETAPEHWNEVVFQGEGTKVVGIVLRPGGTFYGGLGFRLVRLAHQHDLPIIVLPRTGHKNEKHAVCELEQMANEILTLYKNDEMTLELESIALSKREPTVATDPNKKVEMDNYLKAILNGEENPEIFEILFRIPYWQYALEFHTNPRDIAQALERLRDDDDNIALTLLTGHEMRVSAYHARNYLISDYLKHGQAALAQVKLRESIQSFVQALELVQELDVHKQIGLSGDVIYLLREAIDKNSAIKDKILQLLTEQMEQKPARKKFLHKVYYEVQMTKEQLQTIRLRDNRVQLQTRGLRHVWIAKTYAVPIPDERLFILDNLGAALSYLSLGLYEFNKEELANQLMFDLLPKITRWILNPNRTDYLNLLKDLSEIQNQFPEPSLTYRALTGVKEILEELAQYILPDDSLTKPSLNTTIEGGQDNSIQQILLEDIVDLVEQAI
ncbi:MAG: hypothetical protein ABH952_07475 [Candidatus Omnitrophota bacterium]